MYRHYNFLLLFTCCTRWFLLTWKISMRSTSTLSSILEYFINGRGQLRLRPPAAAGWLVVPGEQSGSSTLLKDSNVAWGGNTWPAAFRTTFSSDIFPQLINGVMKSVHVPPGMNCLDLWYLFLNSILHFSIVIVTTSALWHQRSTWSTAHVLIPARVACAPTPEWRNLSRTSNTGKPVDNRMFGPDGMTHQMMTGTSQSPVPRALVVDSLRRHLSVYSHQKPSEGCRGLLFQELLMFDMKTCCSTSAAFFNSFVTHLQPVFGPNCAPRNIAQKVKCGSVHVVRCLTILAVLFQASLIWTFQFPQFPERHICFIKLENSCFSQCDSKWLILNV